MASCRTSQMSRISQETQNSGVQRTSAEGASKRLHSRIEAFNLNQNFRQLIGASMLAGFENARRVEADEALTRNWG